MDAKIFYWLLGFVTGVWGCLYFMRRRRLMPLAEKIIAKSVWDQMTEEDRANYRPWWEWEVYEEEHYFNWLRRKNK